MYYEYILCINIYSIPFKSKPQITLKESTHYNIGYTVELFNYEECIRKTTRHLLWLHGL